MDGAKVCKLDDAIVWIVGVELTARLLFSSPASLVKAGEAFCVCVPAFEVVTLVATSGAASDGADNGTVVDDTNLSRIASVDTVPVAEETTRTITDPWVTTSCFKFFH